VKKGMFARAGDAFAEVIRSSTPITLRTTIPAGSLTNAAKDAGDWATIQMASRVDDPKDWLGRNRNGSSLKLWKSSASLHNYQAEFQAKLERNSLNFAFRASENGNHYGTKIAIVRPGPLPNAALVRYSLVDGREYDHVQIPVAATLGRGENYRIGLTVQDNQFTTLLNGQVISRWTDDKIASGGIGFFDDPDDPQKIAWVSISERDSFLGRMLAHFSLFVVPGTPVK
jgi:hypothetical protein